MDMEWAKDGLDGELYMVQARPETVASQQAASTLETFQLDGKGDVIISGRAVGGRIASGRVRVIADVAHLSEFRLGKSSSPIPHPLTGSR
jgi:Phosphoenolpyruvate synthase/pyruvate phosphate dikinase